jgi:glycosyltransferase involved in cell wall biosynthesis
MKAGLTCIIPFYNEEDRILSVLKKLSSLPQIDAFVLVDDGSTDNSKSLVQEYCHHKNDGRVQLVSYPDNAGKSHAVSV